jgi:hypothetical protein
MKPLWTNTLAWIAAVLVALLLALAVPEGLGVAPTGFDVGAPHTTALPPR